MRNLDVYVKLFSERMIKNEKFPIYYTSSHLRFQQLIFVEIMPILFSASCLVVVLFYPPLGKPGVRDKCVIHILEYLS